MQKRLMAGLGAMALAGAMVVGSTGGAMAGEITGNGKTTPVKDPGVASSICAFSGLNDDPTGGGNPIEAGKVQSWGQIVKKLGPLGGAPGHECRGNVEH